MPALAKQWTEKELLRLPTDDGKYELVDGELVRMSPAHINHGGICMTLGFFLIAHVRKKKLEGIVTDGQTGFWMKNGNLRCPDVSYVSNETTLQIERLPTGFFKGSPDLAVEVVSPSDNSKQLEGKIADYFETGTKLVWIIYPKNRSARIYRQASVKRLISENETLDGEDVIPGFSLRLAELFESFVR